MEENLETAVFAGGCFWCVETIFKRLKGVSSVVSGYSGGDIKDPSYEEVSNGDTGFAEAIEIKFDPKVISFELLLEVFFQVHDPTTLNRQGNDVGTQYRSAIFYMNEKQKSIAQTFIDKLTKDKSYSNPIVTEVTAYKNFYSAESYHQNYYENNRSQPYCRIVIDPKVQKFLKEFSNMVK